MEVFVLWHLLAIPWRVKAIVESSGNDVRVVSSSACSGLVFRRTPGFCTGSKPFADDESRTFGHSKALTVKHSRYQSAYSAPAAVARPRGCSAWSLPLRICAALASVL